VRVRGGGFGAAVREWVADRTIRRRWRRLAPGEWLVVLVAVIVTGAFLLLLGMQALWLAVVIGLAVALYLYRELGA
jgi:fluoride ion exporter CrcB/FEX